MHLRGKGASMEAIYPDGRHELLSQIDNFQFNMWYDNTAGNPSNPHPGDFLTWGYRAVDEMGHMWIGLTTLTQEQYDELVAERERQVSQ